MTEKHVLLIQIYTELLPSIREVAKEHGYAIGVHGSLRRDFDLIAVPWVDNYSDINDLLYAITGTMKLRQNDIDFFINTPEKKPNGRVAYALPLGMGMYIDLSVVGLNND